MNFSNSLGNPLNPWFMVLAVHPAETRWFKQNVLLYLSVCVQLFLMSFQDDDLLLVLQVWLIATDFWAALGWNGCILQSSSSTECWSVIHRLLDMHYMHRIQPACLLRAYTLQHNAIDIIALELLFLCGAGHLEQSMKCDGACSETWVMRTLYIGNGSSTWSQLLTPPLRPIFSIFTTMPSELCSRPSAFSISTGYAPQDYIRIFPLLNDPQLI